MSIDSAVSRIWLEIAGVSPTSADAMSAESVRSMMDEYATRRAPEIGNDIIERLQTLIWAICDAFDVDIPGSDCDCAGECPCHAGRKSAGHL